MSNQNIAGGTVLTVLQFHPKLPLTRIINRNLGKIENNIAEVSHGSNSWVFYLTAVVFNSLTHDKMHKIYLLTYI